MAKIDAFEQRIIQQGMTDDDFSEYKTLLKRVRGNYSKRQHCYTTAIQFPDQYAEQAIKLIQYGLDQFEDNWFTTYTSYLHMGHIYERIRNYQKAFDAYLLAKDVLGLDHPKYVEELSKDLMWMKLHVDSFQYSEALEAYLSCYEKTSVFSKSFVNTAFKIAIVKIVISLHHGRLDEAKQFLETARGICKPNYTGNLHSLLTKHSYNESLSVTPEAIAFMQQLNL